MGQNTEQFTWTPGNSLSAQFSLDQALDDLYTAVWRSQLTPGDELKKQVSEAYRKMVLMAGDM